LSPKPGRSCASAPRWSFIFDASCQVRQITSWMRPMPWLSEPSIEIAPSTTVLPTHPVAEKVFKESGPEPVLERRRRPKSDDASWAIERTLAPRKSSAWPAAFVEHETTPEESKLRLAQAKEEDAPKVAAPFKGAVFAAPLHQKLARACGGLARNVRVSTQADGTVCVKIQSVSTTAERELLDRLLTVPEMASPRVRLEIDVLP